MQEEDLEDGILLSEEVLHKAKQNVEAYPIHHELLQILEMIIVRSSQSCYVEEFLQYL